MMPKNILHIYSSWTAGGAEKVMLDLASGLNRYKLNNYVACPKDSCIYSKCLELGLKPRHLVIKGSFDPFGIISLLLIIRKYDIDILHAHQGKVFWPCIIMKMLFWKRIKVVFHRCADLPHRFYSRLHYRFADRIISISNAVKQGLVRREGVPENKVKVIYNGSDFKRFNEKVNAGYVRNKYGLKDKIVIGTVAAMNRPKGKGQEYLIEAASILKKRHKDALRFLVVGAGPMLEEFENKVLNLELKDYVIFTGYQDEIEKYISAMDIFCLLSWDTEGFGQVMVEAQGMGKPVIGTNIGGIVETLKDNVTGFIIKPKNTDELVDKLELLVNDGELRANMGQNALDFAKKNFSIETMTEKVFNSYTSLYK